MTNNLPEVPEEEPKQRSLSVQLKERGFDPQQWHVLKNSLFPEASNASVLMAIDYCKARGLDIMKKPVHIVPVWDSNLGRMRETVWPSIAELRTTAQRTGQYAGNDRVEYGPEVELTLGSVTIKVPEWAQMTVYRLIGGQRVPFEGDPVYFVEAYARMSRKDATPNGMWMKRPRGQLAKNAEAAALRRAFPEELGGEYSADEMMGLAIDHAAMTDVGTAEEQSPGVTEETRDLTESLRAKAQGNQKADEPEDAEFEDVPEEKPAPKKKAKELQDMTLSDFVNKLAECQTPDAVDDLLDLSNTILDSGEKQTLTNAAAARVRQLEEHGDE